MPDTEEPEWVSDWISVIQSFGLGHWTYYVPLPFGPTNPQGQLY